MSEVSDPKAMSKRVKWVLRGTPASVGKTVRLVLAYLVDRGDERGECWPSVATIAGHLCLSDRSVQRAVGSLVRDKWILVFWQKSGRATNVYRVNLDKLHKSYLAMELERRSQRLSAAGNACANPLNKPKETVETLEVSVENPQENSGNPVDSGWKGVTPVTPTGDNLSPKGCQFVTQLSHEAPRKHPKEQKKKPTTSDGALEKPPSGLSSCRSVVRFRFGGGEASAPRKVVRPPP